MTTYYSMGHLRKILVTQENLDHMIDGDRSQEMSADEIAEALGVQRRTVYRIVEREGWQRLEGLRGRVTYIVPLAFVDAYRAETQRDRKQSQDTTQDRSETVTSDSQRMSDDNTIPITDSLVTLIVGDRDERIQRLEASLADKETVIERLRQELSAALVELAELRGHSKGKDAVIAAKDETIQAKDQAINAANAAVMLMEKQTPALETEAKQIETTETKKPAWKFWG